MGFSIDSIDSGASTVESVWFSAPAGAPLREERRHRGR